VSTSLPQGTYNTLIQRSIDLLELYRRAASTCEPGLRFVLSENAQTLDTMIDELQSQLRASGGTPRQSGTLRGAARRYLGSVTSAQRDVAWIRELSDNESELLHAFEKVVAKLPPDAALALRRQLPRLTSIHLDMDNLAGNAV
jgi:uncharacterized protein (TIGR02284 family)